MSKRIVSICDQHKDRPAVGEVIITIDGVAKLFDACEIDMVGFRAVHDLGVDVSKLTGPLKSRNPKSVRPRTDATLPCYLKDCAAMSRSEGGRIQHMRVHHGMKVSDLRKAGMLT
jgi:hypothetical protein